MEDKHTFELIRKFMRNECSAQELLEVNALIRQGIDESLWQRAMQREQESMEGKNFAMGQAHATMLYEKINKRMQVPRARQVSVNWLKWSSAVAASLAIGYFLFLQIRIWQDKNVHELLTSTQYHERRVLLLTDSSQIWMNSKSTFRYPKRFVSEQRKVSLDGEAFFHVKRDVNKPFIVQAGDMAIRVLGTSFNVKSFSNDDETTITLATGKVEVQWGESHKVELVPGEQLIYNKRDGSFNKTTVDVSESYAWRDGIIQFTRATLPDVARELERWYGVQVYIADPALEKTRITFRQRDQNLKEILEVLAFTANLNYTIQGNSVTLSASK